MDSRGGLRENDERGTERPSLRPVLTTGEGNAFIPQSRFYYSAPRVRGSVPGEENGRRNFDNIQQQVRRGCGGRRTDSARNPAGFLIERVLVSEYERTRNVFPAYARPGREFVASFLPRQSIYRNKYYAHMPRVLRSHARFCKHSRSPTSPSRNV